MSDKNEKNENKFLNLLSDIDENLIQYALDDSIEPEIVTPPDKKQKLIRYIFPAAASLAVVAAVGIGAFIIGQNIPSEPGKTPAQTTIREVTAPSETTSIEATEQETTAPAETTPAETTHRQWTAKEILSQQVWQDIKHYHNIDANDKESIDIIPQFNKVNPYDNTRSGMLTGGIIDRESIGEYDVALLGFNMYIDTSISSEELFIITAKELRLALVKDDKIIDTKELFNPLSPNEPAFNLYKAHLKDYIHVFNFDDGSSIAAFQPINQYNEFNSVLFIGVNDGKLMTQHNSEAGDIEQNNRNYLSPLTETNIEYADNGNKYYTITDNLTKARFRFEYLENDTHNFLYFTKERAYLITDISGFPEFDIDNVPRYSSLSYFDMEEEINNVMPKAIISQIEKDGYTYSLVGENIYIVNDIETYVHCHNLQEVITKNGEYICTIPVYTDDDLNDDATNILADSNSNGNFDFYNLVGYVMDDTVLIINNALLRKSTQFATGCSFYALKDGKLYTLDGYWPDMVNDPPEWTAGKEGYDLIVDTENKTVILDFMKYEFNFKELPAMYNYTISWLKEPLE